MPAPEGYTLVFEDDFDGTELDMSRWYCRGSGPAMCGFFAPSQVAVKDSNLILRGEYRESGDYGPGWYAGMVAIKQRYVRGYFEARFIASEPLPKNTFWSAFWLQAEHPYEAELSCGGPGGAEIDIVEVFHVDGAPAAEINIHCSGMKNSKAKPGGLDSKTVAASHPPTICTGYNTYALEWTEDEYIFTVNGEEIARTSFGDGVSQVGEEVIFSMCLPGEIDHSKDDFREMLVDWVRIYQKD